MCSDKVNQVTMSQQDQVSVAITGQTSQSSETRVDNKECRGMHATDDNSNTIQMPSVNQNDKMQMIQGINAMYPIREQGSAATKELTATIFL